MMQLERVRADKAVEICQGLRLTEAATKLLQPEHTPAEFLTVLQTERQFTTAVEFLAFALPRRDAVWWACLCLGKVGGTALSEAEATALNAAVRWVLEPNETRRQAAQTPGLKAGMAQPGGAVAMAAFWSGGSMMPPDSPTKVAPPPNMLPQMVSSSILRAALLVEPSRRTHCYRDFLALGIGIANGEYLWTS
jgi:hypothetical protein